MTIFTISPAVSGKTTWDLSVDGPLNLGTSGTWTIVPSSNFSVDSKIWGAGGGSGSQGATGGGGGSSTGRISLSSGISYTLIVGGSAAGGSASALGGGGTGDSFRGNGGGYSAIFRTSVSQANTVLMAGGGGGAGGGSGSAAAGAGGGTTGQAGNAGTGAQPGGGTQSAGGAGTGASGSVSGSALTGANGLSGGGGGYYGGASGGDNGSYAPGAGGGSGYINTTYVTFGVTYTGSANTPGNSSDAIRAGSGEGRSGSSGAGTVGRIYIAALPADGFDASIPSTLTSGSTVDINFYHASSAAANTTVSYTITGVTSSDIMGTSLTGNFTLVNGVYTLALSTRPKLSATNTLTISALTFTKSITINPGLAVRYLVVAGGGGGGTNMGGGGGAGGYLAGTNFALTSSSYTIVVGAGGSGAPASPDGPAGSNGQNTTAFGFTAIGGGGGASDHDSASFPAGNGGSGGGGSGGRQSVASYGGLPGTGTAGQGNNGAASGVTWYPGGGGGSGAAATQTGSQQANGGIGTLNDILGSSYYWAAGGGGGGYSTYGGNGGLGGGGGGAPREGAGTTNGTGGGSALNSGSVAEIGALGSQTNKRGGAAGANTGSGGGGGSHYYLTNDGGAGGSGIVVLRYPGGPRGTGGTISTVGSDTVHTFTTSGTLTLFGAGLTANKATAFWGDSITFTYGADLADGATEAYTITGVTSPEISGASLTGNFTFTSGQSSLTINLANLSTTNITTLVLTSGSFSISIPITYVVSVTTSAAGMSWGESRTLTVNTRGLNNGSSIAYSMSGATSAQLSGAALSGNLEVTAVTQSDTRGQYSVLFNGSTGYLSIPAGSTFSFGTGDFTIECFMRTTNNSLVGAGYSRSIMRIGDFDFYLRITAYHGGTDGALVVAGLSSGSTVSLKDGVWHHVALVRESGVIRLWIDGVYQTLGSGSSYTTNHSNADLNTIGGRSNPIDGYFDGHISNVRVVKGTAVYTGTSNFTVPKSGLAAIAGTSLLACRSSNIIDLSTNNHTITVNGTATVNTFNPVPTTFSNYFDGTGDYITVADNAAFEMDADFTIEAFFYCQSLPGAGQFADIITKGAASIFQPYYIFIRDSGLLVFYSSSNGSSWDVANNVSFGTIQVGRWHHVAVSRVSTNLRMFFDGALITTITSGAALTDNNRAVTIGARSDGTEDKFVGWISNVRIVKGVGVYTVAFTVPTSPLTAISGTSLLTCQSNRFVDASANNFALTVNGNTAISSFNPVELASYSNFFDGTTDYLTVPNNSGIQFGTGTFTIEFWMYRATAGTAAGALLAMNAAAYGNWAIVMTGGVMYFQDYYAGNSLNNYFTVDNVGLTSSKWSHVAYVRAADNSSRFYVNGTPVGTAVTDTRDYAGTGSLLIGGVAAGGYGSFNGYISNLRIVKGTALYTSSFTPPTSVLTAITGTQLLTCRSNRFIDLSNNNLTITRSGDTKIDPFIPNIGFTPATASPIGSTTLTITSNPSEPILNQATLIVSTAGTTRTIVIKTTGPTQLQYFKSAPQLIEYIDTEVTDVHAQGLEARVTTFNSMFSNFRLGRESTGVTSIEYIDTEVTDVHNQTLEAKVTTIAQVGIVETPLKQNKTGLTGIVAAPTFAYSSGEDVKVSPPPVQTWYI